MATKTFFLIGRENEKTVSLNLSSSDNLEDLKHDLATSLGIARSETISFHGSTPLNTPSQLLAYNGKIGIKVDANPVRDPFCPPGLPFFGNHFQLHPDHLGNHERLFQKYGSVIKTVNLGTTTYLTDNPEVAQVVLSESHLFTKTTSARNHPLHHMNDDTALFTMDSASPAFKSAHKFMPPSMSPKAMRRHTGNMQNSIQQSFAVFDTLHEQDKSFNLYHYMLKLAGQIIYRIVLGIDVQHFQAVDTPPHTIILKFVEYLEAQKRTQMSPQWFKYLPFGPYPHIKKSHDVVWGMIDQVMKTCEAGGGGKDMPIAECAVNSTCIVDYLNRATDENGEKMPHELCLSNIVALIGAGFATSSCLLSWLVYAMCHYPGDLQTRILQELIDHGATDDKEWTYDELLAMPFLDAFVKETHRLHNPAYQTARNAKQDVVLPGGWFVPAGAVIIPTIPSIHTNKDHWDNPLRFDPDRWLQKSDKKQHGMAYMPFAAGPRGCVGYNVAHLEARTVVAKLVYRYEFLDVSTEPMEYDPDFLVLRPLNVYVRAVRRTKWPNKSK